jgi:hypothetical protein
MTSPFNKAPFLPISFVLPQKPEDWAYWIINREVETATFLNQRDIGTYYPSEVVNGQQWITTSAQKPYQAFRKVINFGTLPNATTKSVAHGITFTTGSVVTRLYGVATNPVSTFSYLPLPYASPTLNQCIALNADGTNINIITGIDRTAYTVCYVVIEYLKG